MITLTRIYTVIYAGLQLRHLFLLSEYGDIRFGLVDVLNRIVTIVFVVSLIYLSFRLRTSGLLLWRFGLVFCVGVLGFQLATSDLFGNAVETSTRVYILLNYLFLVAPSLCAMMYLALGYSSRTWGTREN